MNGFTKLVPEIVQSSIWNEPSDIRIVWITLLAIKDADGYVRGDSQVISRMANVPVESAVQALEKFQQPDPNSHTPDNEGRRIEQAPGGWIVLNHYLYRERDTKGDHAEYMRKWREKKDPVNICESQVNHPSVSASVSLSVLKKEFSIPDALNTPEFQKAWENWQQHRKEIKKPLTVKSVEMQMKEFMAWGPTGAVEAIEHTIKKGWQGIRRPEHEANSKPSYKSYAADKNAIRDRAVAEIVLRLKTERLATPEESYPQIADRLMLDDKYQGNVVTFALQKLRTAGSSQC